MRAYLNPEDLLPLLRELESRIVALEQAPKRDLYSVAADQAAVGHDSLVADQAAVGHDSLVADLAGALQECGLLLDRQVLGGRGGTRDQILIVRQSVNRALKRYWLEVHGYESRIEEAK